MDPKHPQDFKNYSKRSQYRFLESLRKAKKKVNEEGQSKSMCFESETGNRNDDTLLQLNHEVNVVLPSDEDNESLSEPEQMNIDESASCERGSSSNEDHPHSSATGESSDDDVDPVDNFDVDVNNEYPEGIIDSDSDTDLEPDENDLPDREIEDPPLYEGALIGEGESLMCILSFAMRFSLTGNALNALLKLISLHCPMPNRCKKSLYLFKKHFSSMAVPLRRRYYCSVCNRSLDSTDSICADCIQRNPQAEREVAYFIDIPLKDQLRILYKRPGFVRLLHHRFERRKKKNDNLEDIYDGLVYKEFSRAPNFLSNRNNISFTWNADGVSLFRSSKFQIWPFYLSINELPYIHRTRKENLLLAGLWFGVKKPEPGLFLDSICDDLDELQNGVDFEVPGRNSPIHVQSQVICGTCDLPAKALFLNMKQYNGKHGCQKCLIESEPFEPGSNIRIFAFQRNLRLRTQQETDDSARIAYRLNKDDNGVKGPSVIARLTRSYIRATAVDTMHCVFLGIVKALLSLWFSPGSGILSEFAGTLDSNIRSMTPPDFVPRLPRSIIENLAYLKAHELKIWFYYYSLPILKTMMSTAYFNHYILLLQSMYLLHQDSISEDMINCANELIKRFVEQFADYYGRRNMTPNLHQLLHLTQNVRDFGPAWTTSCFPYENANGILRTLVTGTKFAQLQICTGVSLFMNVPELMKKLVLNNPPSDFCKTLMNKQNKYKMHNIAENLSVVGIFDKRNEIPRIVSQALLTTGINGTNLKVFYRFYKSGILYTSELYKRCTKTKSMYIKYNNDDIKSFGMIHSFVKVSNCECDNFCRENCNDRYFAIIKKCRTSAAFFVQQNIPLEFIHRCITTDIVSAVDVREIISPCFYIKLKSTITVACNNYYIVEPVNMLEIE